jgi:hypothetical protein
MVPTRQIPPLAYVPASEKGQADGVATLDASGKVPASQLDVQATFDGDMQGAPLVNLGAGAAATDGVNKGQMDGELATKLNASAKSQPNGIATLDAAGQVPTAQIPPLAYVPTAEKGQAGGVASLNASGKVPTAQIPPLAYVPTSQKGKANGVATLDGAGKVPSAQLPPAPPFPITLSGTDHGVWIDILTARSSRR